MPMASVVRDAAASGRGVSFADRSAAGNLASRRRPPRAQPAAAPPTSFTGSLQYSILTTSRSLRRARCGSPTSRPRGRSVGSPERHGHEQCPTRTSISSWDVTSLPDGALGVTISSGAFGRLIGRITTGVESRRASTTERRRAQDAHHNVPRWITAGPTEALWLAANFATPRSDGSPPPARYPGLHELRTTTNR